MQKKCEKLMKTAQNGQFFFDLFYLCSIIYLALLCGADIFVPQMWQFQDNSGITKNLKKYNNL